MHTKSCAYERTEFFALRRSESVKNLTRVWHFLPTAGLADTKVASLFLSVGIVKRKHDDQRATKSQMAFLQTVT
jgi:hypothetical protein